jgi:hypothetical protein
MQEIQAGFSFDRLPTGATTNPSPVAARFFITSPLLLSTLKGTEPFVDRRTMIWYCHTMWVMQAHSQRRMLWYVAIVALTVLFHVSAHAIEVNPTGKQIQKAVDEGKQAAEKQRSPESFYVWFGVSDAAHPKGFLLTKVGRLSVMATHMALRGLEPSQADLNQILQDKTMFVSTAIVGETRNFAVDSYMVLEQGGKIIKPVMVRFDAQAERSAMWPASPKFKAKVVASFNYADFDPNAETTITVHLATGGEASFPVKFLDIH